MKQRAIKSKEDPVEMAKIFKETAELQKQYKDFQEEKRNTETLIDENVGKYNNINIVNLINIANRSKIVFSFSEIFC
jgi:hypothetical protein